jgi:hypothetical protein
MMQEAQERGKAYLFKIRQSLKIKELLAGSFAMDQWEGAGQGWEGCWSEVRLAGWTAQRRVIILRRPLREELVVSKRKGKVRRQAQMELETRDALLFRISATVVDIRPNGTFVIEARKTVRDNDELWERALTGIIRREDVLPNNTVLSENVAELSIFKRELGHVRDGYKRGWFTYWFDRFSPF